MSEGPWKDCVGMKGEEAREKIQAEASDVKVQIVPHDSMVTADYRTDRVRIFVDESGKVARAPNRGWRWRIPPFLFIILWLLSLVMMYSMNHHLTYNKCFWIGDMTKGYQKGEWYLENCPSHFNSIVLWKASLRSMACSSASKNEYWLYSSGFVLAMEDDGGGFPCTEIFSESFCESPRIAPTFLPLLTTARGFPTLSVLVYSNPRPILPLLSKMEKNSIDSSYIHSK